MYGTTDVFISASDDLETLSNMFPETILICAKDGPMLTLTHYMAIFQASHVSNSGPMVLWLL